MSEQIQNQMQDRVASGLDPLTGEPMQTVGTWLVLTCYDDDLNIQAVRATKVDDEQIKPDTHYRLVASGGDFIFQEA